MVTVLGHVDPIGQPVRLSDTDHSGPNWLQLPFCSTEPRQPQPAQKDQQDVLVLPTGPKFCPGLSREVSIGLRLRTKTLLSCLHLLPQIRQSASHSLRKAVVIALGSLPKLWRIVRSDPAAVLLPKPADITA